MKQKDENGPKQPLDTKSTAKNGKNPVIINGAKAKVKPKRQNKCDLGPDFVAPGKIFDIITELNKWGNKMDYSQTEAGDGWY